MRTFQVLAIAILAAAAATAAPAGDVYKWTDKDGKVHYGDKPKHDAQEVQVGPSQGKGPMTGEQEQQLASRTAECDRARAQLDTYMKAPMIKETDNLGRTREYTPEERTQFLAMQQKKADDACKALP